MRKWVKMAILVGLWPLVWRNPRPEVMWLTGVAAIFFILGILTTTKARWILLGLWLGLSVVNSLHSIEIWDYPASVNQERLIWSSVEAQKQIEATQKEALYLPYSLRKVVFSSGVWIYRYVGNFWELWRPDKVLDNFGVLGVGCLGAGICALFKKEKKWFGGGVAVLTVVGLVAGLSRYPVFSNGFYPWLPFFGVVNFEGIKNLPEKIFWGLALITVIFRLV